MTTMHFSGSAHPQQMRQGVNIYRFDPCIYTKVSQNRQKNYIEEKSFQQLRLRIQNNYGRKRFKESFLQTNA